MVNSTSLQPTDRLRDFERLLGTNAPSCSELSRRLQEEDNRSSDDNIKDQCSDSDGWSDDELKYTQDGQPKRDRDGREE